MTILVNDHPGHSFVLELSKSFSKNGNKVFHAYCPSFASPKGNFNIEEEKYSNLKILPIDNKGGFNKYSLIKRWKQEKEYSKKLISVLQKHELPNIIVGGNAPIFVQHYLQKFSKKNKIPFIFWCQDIHSIAIRSYSKKKLGILGYPIYAFFEMLEKKIACDANQVIVISNDFIPVLNKWGIYDRISCIPNWAPINEIELLPKVNDWTSLYCKPNSFKIIYSGTLGVKHNPQIILKAAIALSHNDDIEFIVISEGIGAEYLNKEIEKHELKNIKVLPFQSFNDFSKVLASADVLIAILEEDANLFSVPSKVLSYMCSNRAILLAVPFENLSAKIIMDNNAGICVSPGDAQGFIKGILTFFEDESIRKQCSRNARNYAEKNFDINHIQNQFLSVMQKTFAFN